MIKLIKENTLAIKLDISEALSALGKVDGDITDIAFTIKNDKKDTDENALVYKTKVGGAITFTSPYYYIQVDPADYALIEVGRVYEGAIGIKYAGITKFIELELDDCKIRVEQDSIRS